MEDIDKEISEMKISLNARARIVAEGFLKNVSVLLVQMCQYSSCGWIGHLYRVGTNKGYAIC